MDNTTYEAAKEAYQRGDWSSVVTIIGQSKLTGEVNGAADHLVGNALMKLGRFSEAADAYQMALNDTTYQKSGALNCNRGRALMAAGRTNEAIEALTAATQDVTYQTPYKAYMALGSAYMALGQVREAGNAFRSAAQDTSNPNPASALQELGGVFMKLGRPLEAIEVYRTTLDFSTPLANQGPIYADLASAYVAANRMSEAVDAFGRATADGVYQLTPAQAASYSAAQKAIAAMAAREPSETDAFLEAAGYGSGTGSFDPLDPLGESGEMMPSPEDTGFFSVTESDLIKADKAKRKKRHPVRNFFIVLFILLLICAGVGGFGYYKGYGWPTQQTVITNLFDTAAAGGDISPYLAASVSEQAKGEIQSSIGASKQVTIDGLDKSMTTSQAHVKATLADGSTQDYVVQMTRDGISWKVTSVAFDFSSLTGSASGTNTTSGTVDTSTTAQSTTADTSASSVEAATQQSAETTQADQSATAAASSTN